MLSLHAHTHRRMLNPSSGRAVGVYSYSFSCPVAHMWHTAHNVRQAQHGVLQSKQVHVSHGALLVYIHTLKVHA